MQNPNEKHPKVAKRVLKYIKGTIEYGIWFKKFTCLKLIGYTDSDWAGSCDNMKSTSAVCSQLAQVHSAGILRSERL